MLEHLQNLDQTLTLALNGSHSLWLDHFALSATSTLTWVPAALVLLAVVIRRGEMKEIFLMVAAFVLCVLLADQIASSVFKPLVARPRPTNDPLLMLTVDVVGGYRGGAYGFFSSHAANTFAIATFASLLMRHRSLTAVLFSWAALNCWSRVYLGVHYVGDLVCGALCGALIGWGIYCLFLRFAPNYSPARQEALHMGYETSPSGFSIPDLRFLSLTMVLLYILCALRGLFI